MNQQPPTQTSGETTSELRSDAKHLGRSASNRIHSEVDARRDSAATQAKSVSSAIERAAGEMDQDTPDWLKSALKQGATKIQTFADTIERKDSRELLRDAQDFARNNQGTFLLACAAAGFAAARILKAGGEQQASGANQDQFGGSRATSPNQPHAPAVGSSTGEFV